MIAFATITPKKQLTIPAAIMKNPAFAKARKVEIQLNEESQTLTIKPVKHITQIAGTLVTKRPLASPATERSATATAKAEAHGL